MSFWLILCMSCIRAALWFDLSVSGWPLAHQRIIPKGVSLSVSVLSAVLYIACSFPGYVTVLQAYIYSTSQKFEHAEPPTKESDTCCITWPGHLIICIPGGHLIEETVGPASPQNIWGIRVLLKPLMVGSVCRKKGFEPHQRNDNFFV